MPNNPMSFRLSDEAVEILKEIEDRRGLKRSAIVETLIRDADPRESKPAKKNPKKGAETR